MYLHGPLLLPELHLVASWIPVVRHGVWHCRTLQATSTHASPAPRLKLATSDSAPQPRPLSRPPWRDRLLIGRSSARRDGIGNQIGAGLGLLEGRGWGGVGRGGELRGSDPLTPGLRSLGPGPRVPGRDSLLGLSASFRVPWDAAVGPVLSRERLGPAG